MADHRPVPTFRPNVRLSNLRYDGGQKDPRDYRETVEKIRRQIEGQRND